LGSNAANAATARFHLSGHKRGANAAAKTPKRVAVKHPATTPAVALPPAAVTAAYAKVAVAEFTSSVAATIIHGGVPAVL